jgi:ribosomal peptide maturation radical SAM protein 1
MVLRRGNDVSVILVVPPVINPIIPTLGAPVLAPACRKAGIQTHVHFASVTFAAKVGFELCLRLASAPPRTMIGDAVFWGAAFPDRAERHRHILDVLMQVEEPLHQIERLSFPSEEEILGCVAQIPSFVSETVERLLAYSPLVVGLSSMCQQTLASIAIASEIKRVCPDVITILGGANAAEPMGSALLEVTDAFDFIFSGEADFAFPDFCRNYLERGELPSERVIKCDPVSNLDKVEPPDYNDYYADIYPLREKDSLAALAPIWLIFESSRGCWWADRHNCAFCGFNAPGARYRVKSPDRVVAEIEELTIRYGVSQIYASDTIMARDLPSSVLARVAERGLDCSLSYEVKSNLDEADLDIFVRAGVNEIQPGIESLSSHVLQLMSKGVKALENVRFLRDCGSRGVNVIWNLLTCIPGERREDYEQMIALIPLLEHLHPPTRWGPIRISRFSPYYRDPGKYGIRGLRPWTAYVEFYGDRAEQLAHHFFGEYETEFTRELELMSRLHNAMRCWASSWLQAGGPPGLSIRKLDDGRVAVRDGRAVAQAGIYLLSPEMTEALKFVQRPKRIGRIPKAHRAALDHLVALGFVAYHEGEFLALPLDPEIGERLRNERQILLKRAARLSAR